MDFKRPSLGIDRVSLRRSDWTNMPPVVIHAPQSAVKTHPLYGRAKAGDPAASEGLVLDCIDSQQVDRIAAICTPDVSLLAVHALETDGMNAIPRVFASILAKTLGFSVAKGVIQSNSVGHTGASGIHRLAFPALFEGAVHHGKYFLVDDFIGQGGTIANLKGHIESSGGMVLGATTLTGRSDSAVVTLTERTLDLLRYTHGTELEEWWIDTFGYSLERLTESEARYLARVDSLDAIRKRIADARGARD